jgi:hypothetical protein
MGTKLACHAPLDFPQALQMNFSDRCQLLLIETEYPATELLAAHDSYDTHHAQATGVTLTFQISSKQILFRGIKFQL